MTLLKVCPRNYVIMKFHCHLKEVDRKGKRGPSGADANVPRNTGSRVSGCSVDFTVKCTDDGPSCKASGVFIVTSRHIPVGLGFCGLNLIGTKTSKLLQGAVLLGEWP